MICKNRNEDDNRNEIISKLNKNMFVEAGAGAGKTTLIVSRVVNQLKSGYCKPEELVVITFTNKAAEELFDRIVLEIRKAIDETEDIVERQNLQAALDDIDLMNVSTIHSFCKTMIMERAFDAGVPLDARVIENDEETKIKNAFFEHWFMKYDNRNIMDKGNVVWEYSYAAKIKETFCDISNLPEEVCVYYNEELTKKDAGYFITALNDVLCRAKDKILEIINNGEEGKISTLSEAENVIKKDYIWLEERLTTSSDYKELIKLIKEIKDKKKFNKEFKPFKENGKATEKAKAKERNKCFSTDAINGIMDVYNSFKHALVMIPAIDAANEYRAQKSSKLLSNDDLLQVARRLIIEKEEARVYFKNKYKCIYVDEFQDTDHIQEEMLWQLSLEEGSDNMLRDGALFLVGDPKQSIYRFRGAELPVYFKAKEKMSRCDNAIVYELNRNFRSNSAVVGWVNAQFSEKFEKMTDIMSYNDMEFKNKATGRADILEGVYKYDEKITGSKIEDKAQVNAQNLCNLIQNIKANCRIKYNADDGIRKSRPVEYSDFLILYSNKTHIDIYYNELINNNIPVDMGGKHKIFEDKMISRYVVLYNYLANRFSNKERVGAVQIALGDDFSYNDLQKLGNDRIDALYEKTRGMSGYALAEYLLHQKDILLPDNCNLLQSDVYSAQVRLQQMVEYVLSSCKGNRQELAAQFSLFRNKELEREMPLTENRNAVRLMNFHQAKGLEGNVVIITKRTDKLGFSQNSHMCDASPDEGCDNAKTYGKVYYKSIKLSDNAKLPGYENDVIRSKAEDAEKNENMRLQYVAATRAREALIVMEAIEKVTSFAEFDYKDCPSVENLFVNNTTEKDTAVYQAYNVPRWEAELTENQIAKQFDTLNPSRFEKYSNHRHDDSAELTEESAAQGEEAVEEADEQTVKGAVFGTAMHRCFELIVNEWKKRFDISEADVDKLINASVCQAVIEGLEDIPENEVDTYKDTLKKMANGFVKDDEIVNALKNAKAIYTELPFSYYTDVDESKELISELNFNADSNKLWINGIADLVIKNADGSIIIIDFKSDDRKGCPKEEFKDELMKRYSGQLTLYRYALGKAMNVALDKISCRICNYR